MLDYNGNPVLDAAGKPRWAPMAEWLDRPTANRFSAAVIAALEDEYPDDIAPTIEGPEGSGE